MSTWHETEDGWLHTITKALLQEVMFELYDVSNGDRKMSKAFAKELADKLKEIEWRVFDVKT